MLQPVNGRKPKLSKLTDIGTWTMLPPGNAGTPRLVAMTLDIKISVYKFYQEPAMYGFSLVLFGHADRETYCLPGGFHAQIDTLPVIYGHDRF